jgi:hypothetical protein
LTIRTNYRGDWLKVLWSGWEAYFHIMEYEGDRTVDVNKDCSANYLYFHNKRGYFHIGKFVTAT